jgi:hypothetical protein
MAQAGKVLPVAVAALNINAILNLTDVYALKVVAAV